MWTWFICYCHCKKIKWNYLTVICPATKRTIHEGTHILVTFAWIGKYTAILIQSSHCKTKVVSHCRNTRATAGVMKIYLQLNYVSVCRRIIFRYSFEVVNKVKGQSVALDRATGCSLMYINYDKVQVFNYENLVIAIQHSLCFLNLVFLVLFPAIAYV